MSVSYTYFGNKSIFRLCKQEHTEPYAPASLTYLQYEGAAIRCLNKLQIDRLR
jgi:hypothetical protein